MAAKWIADLAAHTRIDDSARRILTIRLEAVRDQLSPALTEAEKDPEHVHQLRVSTRRARAALDVFESCLPAKVYRKAKKRLRSIRRAAGEARDWDVFLDSLLAKQVGRQRHRFDFLVGFTVSQRWLARTNLEQLGDEYPFAFDRFLAETVASVQRSRLPDCDGLIDLARPVLANVLQEFVLASHGNLVDEGPLHQLRITGKKLRYSMELFASCFDGPFRTELYPQVEEMQEILGQINDSYVAIRRLEGILGGFRVMLPAASKNFQETLRDLIDFYRRRLPALQVQFASWLASWREAGAEANFVALLLPPAVKPASISVPFPGLRQDSEPSPLLKSA
ncbi:MAG: CHAD domain-containing protein [Gemmataceae bacterium]